MPPGSSKPRRKQPAESDLPVGDFYNPFFDVIFYRASSVEVVTDDDLAILRGEDTTPAPATRTRFTTKKIIKGREFEPDPDTFNLRQYAASLEVVVRGEQASAATLTFTPPYDDGIKILDAPGIRFATKMEIEWGYVGSDGSEPIISDKSTFTISEPKADYDGPDITITVVGADIMSLAYLHYEARRVYKRANFKNDFAIIKELVESRLKMELVERNLVPATSDLKKRKRKDIIQREPTWDFFRRLIEENDAGFYVTGTQVYIYDNETADAKKPRYRLVYNAQLESDRDIPVRTVKINPHLSIFSGPPNMINRGQSVNSYNHARKKREVRKSNPNEIVTVRIGGNKVQSASPSNDRTSDRDVKGDVDIKGTETGRHRSQPANRPNAAERSDAEAKWYARNKVTIVIATTPGVPVIKPQMKVVLDGVGESFRGVYRVLQITHSLGLDGYDSTMRLVRHTTSADPTSAKPSAPRAGRVNTEAINDEDLAILRGVEPDENQAT